MTESNDLLLSIVIPSYNRAKLLSDLLRKIDRENYLPFKFEVIVTDNDSPDPLYGGIRNFEPKNYLYRYYRHKENIGAVPNIFSGFRLARGQFTLHLADDDELAPDVVVDIIDKMLAEPGIGATFALYQAIQLPANTIIQDYRFEAGTYTLESAGAMADMLAAVKTPMPENAIYRTDIAVRALFEGTVWRYVYVVLARFLTMGSLCFYDRPFYLSYSYLDPTVIEAPRESEKFDFAAWELVSRGFNVFYYWATGRRVLEISKGPSQTASVQFLRTTFFDTQDKKLFVQAAEIMHHVESITDVELTTPDMRKNLMFLSNLDVVFNTVRHFPGISELIVVGYGSEIVDIINQYIRTRGVGVVTRTLFQLQRDEAIRYAYLTPTDALRSSVLQMTSTTPGAVFSMESLGRAFDLQPIAGR